MRTPEIISPYSLLQEELWAEKAPDWEWRILATCIMLNLTTAKQVRQVMGPLFQRYPDHEKMMLADEEDVRKIISPLGLQNRRVRSLMGMSTCYQHFLDGKDLLDDMFGVGNYARDSYLIFVSRQTPDHIELVGDKELRNFTRWALSL